ncbi:MAG: hypothetical protein HC875_17930 [Anaerolineales bacterium]|nr:hypothetical protein [Anaerolineales bacterium]
MKTRNAYQKLGKTIVLTLLALTLMIPSGQFNFLALAQTPNPPAIEPAAEPTQVSTAEPTGEATAEPTQDLTDEPVANPIEELTPQATNTLITAEPLFEEILVEDTLDEEILSFLSEEGQMDVGLEVTTYNDEAVNDEPVDEEEYIVDIFVLSSIASHYGSNEPNADINGDGIVNILDLAVTANYYGQPVPEDDNQSVSIAGFAPWKAIKNLFGSATLNGKGSCEPKICTSASGRKVGCSYGKFMVRGSIYDKYRQLGQHKGFLGCPIESEQASSGGQRQKFYGGSIYWSPDVGAFEVHGLIRKKWQALGAENSFLGYPITDETSTPQHHGRVGRYNHFEDGSIYWEPGAKEAFSIRGPIRDKWASLGWERSILGYPISDERFFIDKKQQAWQYNTFEEGWIFWREAAGAIAMDRNGNRIK